MKIPFLCFFIFALIPIQNVHAEDAFVENTEKDTMKSAEQALSEKQMAAIFNEVAAPRPLRCLSTRARDRLVCVTQEDSDDDHRVFIHVLSHDENKWSKEIKTLLYSSDKGIIDAFFDFDVLDMEYGDTYFYVSYAIMPSTQAEAFTHYYFTVFPLGFSDRKTLDFRTLDLASDLFLRENYVSRHHLRDFRTSDLLVDGGGDQGDKLKRRLYGHFVNLDVLQREDAEMAARLEARARQSFDFHLRPGEEFETRSAIDIQINKKTREVEWFWVHRGRPGRILP